MDKGHADGDVAVRAAVPGGAADGVRAGAQASVVYHAFESLSMPAEGHVGATLPFEDEFSSAAGEEAFEDVSAQALHDKALEVLVRRLASSEVLEVRGDRVEEVVEHVVGLRVEKVDIALQLQVQRVLHVTPAQSHHVEANPESTQRISRGHTVFVAVHGDGHPVT